MGDWQPIETAPKDGTVILVYSENQIVTASWSKYTGGPGVSSDKEQPRNWCVHANGNQLLDEGWDSGAGWFMEVNPPPTHWMSLPEPPPCG